MHIPDGFLSTSVWLPAWGVSAGLLSVFIRKATRVFKDKLVPLTGVMAAFIFAAQMFNFPVAAGTSGHLLGGVLAAVLLGPWVGAVVIAVVLIVQCFVFLDGGVTALGANIFNMSVIGSVGGFFIYRAVAKIIKSKKGILIGAAIAAWFSVVAASILCAVELGLSGIVPLKAALIAMSAVHALIGIGEAAITVVIISFVLKVRPDLIYKPE
ncbi:MAG: energy-coupling factor ABC transporter permease [Candidatus Omnitrophota bacterium]